jgi:hypothetical protein
MSCSALIRSAPWICTRWLRERLAETLAPGGSTGTSRAPLRQTRGGRSAGARVPPVDYRDELRQRQPVHYVPEHLSTISPAFTSGGRG